MTDTKADKPNVKKELGNPKITFVVGGPASGKGTQCAKLVEEFGYTHISTGDLFRDEAKKGTREGDRFAKLMKEGALIPSELVVDILVNAMIATPSHNYLIDGFPRELMQAKCFENNVCPAQRVLYFSVSESICLERCLGRAAATGGGREDDKAEILLKRLENYSRETRPVIDFYRQFGKVREVNGEFDELKVYAETRKAMLPQVSFIIGPRGSGKTCIGKALCEVSNQKMLNFSNFIEENKLVDKDDETVMQALIKHLADEICPNVLIEGFPKTEFQAKYFIRNCVEPFRVFALKCSKDTCQERMISVGTDSEDYQASTILAKKIREYNENCQKLMPFLEKCTNLRIVDAEQSMDQAICQIRSFVEPTILHVRVGGSDQAQANGSMICSSLQEEQEYFPLNVNDLCRDEIDRRTPIGMEIENLNASGMLVPNELYVRMLRSIIYNGDCSYDKFLLIGFPETPEALCEFEQKCARITAIIYASAPGPVVEIMHDNLNNFNIDSLFAKQNRLKTMKNWDARELEEQLGNRTEWGMVCGRSLSGKTTVAKMIAAVNRGKIVNMTEVAEECKKKMGSEEEPFEGEVPLEEVQKGICAMVNADKACGQHYAYIFDGYMHKSADEFLRWFSGEFGAPTFHLNLVVDKDIIKERFREKNGIGEGDELGEEQQAELAQQSKAAEAEKKCIEACLREIGGKTQIIDGFSTDTSEESTKERIRSEFCAKIILMNHDPKLEVDVACSNLAIKYNMLYLSVFQLIKEQIEKCTAMGKALASSCQRKALSGEPAVSKDTLAKDEFEFSAVHYDLPLVIQLIKQTIQERRTTQQFILLEGLCNATKLKQSLDKLQMRQMDELFALEKNIGEVNSVISLLFCKEETTIPESKIKYEKFEAPIVVEKKVERVEGDDDDAPPDEPPADDGEPVKKAFNPAEFEWTITNGESKNLPQLFRDFKGNTIDQTMNADDYAATSQLEAVGRALNDFCYKVCVEDQGQRNYFRQVVFNDC